MTSLIPKEKLTAYERWELASFDSDRPRTVRKTAADVAADTAARLAEERRASVAEAQQAGYAAGLEQGRTDGFEQGRTAGFEQGHAEGFAQGLAESQEQLAEEKARLQQMADTFGAEIAHASERISSDVLELALDLSKAMLKQALNVRPELVIPIVGNAIRYLPALQQPALLMLHPDDVALVTRHMADELTKAGWRVVEDAQMERGGCRVETGSNQIDASAPSRWQRIAAALGKESDWLAP